MTTVLVIWGIRRSGIHALVTWQQQLLESDVWIFNNLSKDAVPGADPYKSLFFTDSYRADLEQQPHIHIPTQADRDIPKKSAICIYEDSPLCSVNLRQYFDRKSTFIHLVICRDPFNMLASRMKLFKRCPLTEQLMRHDGHCDSSLLCPRSALDLWVEYATIFKNGCYWPNSNTIAVPFNKFVSDQSYRRELAALVGRPFIDTGISRVSGAGGGSSFEGISKNDYAQEMNTNERWLLARESCEYRDLFKGRTDVLELSESLFGTIPGTSDLV